MITLFALMFIVGLIGFVLCVGILVVLVLIAGLGTFIANVVKCFRSPQDRPPED